MKNILIVHIFHEKSIIIVWEKKGELWEEEVGKKLLKKNEKNLAFINSKLVYQNVPQKIPKSFPQVLHGTPIFLK